MGDLAATAEKLRQTREATRNFLTLYALERLRDRVKAQSQPQRVTSTASADHLDDETWAVLLRESLGEDWRI